MTDKTRAERPRRVFGPVLLLLVCVFGWASLLTFDAGDWPSSMQYPHNDPARNACGPVGAAAAYAVFHYLGDGAYPLILFASMGAGLWLIHGYIRQLWQRLFGLLLLVAGTAAAVHLISTPDANTLPVGDGGVAGRAAGEFLRTSFSGLGAALVLGWSLIVGLLLTAEGWMLRLPRLVKRVGQASGEAIAMARAAGSFGTAGVPAGGPALRTGRATPAAESPSGPAEPKINVHHAGRKSRPQPDARQGELFEDEPATGDAGRSGTAAPATKTALVKRDRPAEESPPIKGGRADPASRAVEDEGPDLSLEPYPREIEAWQIPPLSLLRDPVYTFSAQQEALVRAKAQTLERTLDEFRLDARVVEIDTGPVISMYELQLAPGIKVSQVASLSNDIARALKAPAVRVVAPLPGKNTIGIEVPNLDKEIVRLKELITLAGRRTETMALPLFVGKDASGAALVTDLTSMPHVLMAGTTGSGKSVCINSIVASILMTQRPDRVKLILVDPKMVEMAQFKDVPHLMCPIVTDLQRAESILEWAVTKMEERYELLAEARVRNIKSYNQLSREQIEQRFQPTTDDERARIPAHLPYVVIIIDELADLMMRSAKEVEHNLSRLAQKSRAVGIHIVVATQRPEVKVVTGLIKSNLPCRIAFRVASRMDSRIVLDQNGAETLMGEGDMLFLPPGSSKLIRAQGTFVDDTELHNVIEYLRDQAEPDFHPELLRLRVQDAGSPEERDALFDDAVRIILETRRGSVSLLQRRLGVGYARASRLIEQMADAGIVGHYKGSQAREVTMTLDEYEARQDQEFDADSEDTDEEPSDSDDDEEDEEEEEEDEEEDEDYEE